MDDPDAMGTRALLIDELEKTRWGSIVRNCATKTNDVKKYNKQRSKYMNPTDTQHRVRKDT